MKKILITAMVLLNIAVTMNSCSSQTNESNKYTTTDSGLKYVITQEGNGKQAQPGDKVEVHYTGKLLDGTVFDSSVERGQPISFELGTGRVIRGWDEGIALLKEGDKATFEIPSNLAYGERAMGKIPANSTLVFDVELISVTKPVNVEPFNVEGKDTLTTESGLKYIIVEKGDGNPAMINKKVSVHYTGYFEDGNIFDSSVKRGTPIEFPLGAGRVIKGWDEGIALMSEGDKMRLIIPYQLAYGEQGYPGAIPPKATLIFDVELVKVSE